MSTTAPTKKKPRPGLGSVPNLNSVMDSAEQAGNVIVLHTQPGWGKSSLCANIPDNLFLMTGKETGLLTLMRNKQVGKTKHYPQPAQSWSEAEIGVKELIVQNHPYRFLTIDTFSGLIKILEQEHINTKYNGDASKYHMFGGNQGAKELLPKIDKMMNDFQKLAVDKGMTIILLCHSTIRQFKNPDGNNYDRWWPEMHQTIWQQINEAADMVLFGTFEVFVETAKGADVGAKGKAKGGSTRLIKTEWNASFDAKNRHGLSPTIVCGKSAKETALILGREMTKNRVEETLDEHPDSDDSENETEEQQSNS